MRILQLCNKAPFPANDGSSIAIYNMGMGLLANGVELHVLTINTKKHFKNEDAVDKDYKIKSNYISVYRNTDISIIGVISNIFSSDSYFVSRFYFKDFELQLIKKLSTFIFDVIQLEGLFMGIYIPVIRKHSKAKIVLRAHNIEHLIWQRHIKSETSLIKKKYLQIQNNRLKKFESIVIKEVDSIVSITDIDKKIIFEMGFRKPMFTCITGVDVHVYRSKAAVNKKLKSIFHFASMDWMPNVEAVDWFLKYCWPDVLKAIPDVKFVIAGRNMPERFIQLVHPNITVIESVNDAGNFFKEHEVMLVPLLSGSGLRIKIIEGMAYGKAIVTTSIGAEGIQARNKKNIMIEDSPENFSKAVIELMSSNEKRVKMETEAFHFAEKEFDNTVIVEGLVNFYKMELNV